MIKLLILTFCLGFNPRQTWIFKDNWSIFNETGFYLILKNPDSPKDIFYRYKLLRENCLQYSYPRYDKPYRWGLTWFVTPRIVGGFNSFDFGMSWFWFKEWLYDINNPEEAKFR